MTTTLTPPPAGSGTPAPQGPSQTPGSSRVVAIVVIVVGALIVLGTITSALISTIVSASVTSTTRTVAVTDVTDLDVDVAAGSLRVEFADVDEAELDVTGTGGADRWTLRTEGGELIVSSPQGWLNGGWPFGGWPFGENGAGNATLRLPQSLEGLDAELSLAAGELFVDEGEFGEVELDMGAGRTRFSASVDTISADVSAGNAEFTIDGAREAGFSVSAGSLDAELTGAQPRSLELDVSAGQLEIVVPEGEYDVTSDVSAGEFDNRIGSVPDADSTIDVSVSAGKAVLRTE